MPVNKIIIMIKRNIENDTVMIKITKKDRRYNYCIDNNNKQYNSKNDYYNNSIVIIIIIY